MTDELIFLLKENGIDIERVPLMRLLYQSGKYCHCSCGWIRKEIT